MSPELQKKSVSAEELAKLIDAVGECNWQRFQRYKDENHFVGQLTFLGFFIVFIASIFLCFGFGLFVGLIVFGGSFAYPFYAWQRWISLRGELEDAMLVSHEDEIASAISIATWEYVGYDSAERVRKRGRAELESFAVLRHFEPNDLERAHSAIKNPAVAKKLREEINSRKKVENYCVKWGVFAGFITAVLEFILIYTFWPQILSNSATRSERKLLFWIPIVVGFICYILLITNKAEELQRLSGLSRRSLRKIKRQANIEKTKVKSNQRPSKDD
ncbi:MAG: hypothetical protein KF824_12815 [Fimbriimonadaceae bacterium]|nr:MAG: hypothetical protein KF824_12815 [Fimbriimonadaceae bacterium]